MLKEYPHIPKHILLTVIVFFISPILYLLLIKYIKLILFCQSALLLKGINIFYNSHGTQRPIMYPPFLGGVCILSGILGILFYYYFFIYTIYIYYNNFNNLQDSLCGYYIFHNSLNCFFLCTNAHP